MSVFDALSFFRNIITPRSLARALPDLAMTVLCVAVWIAPLSMLGFLKLAEMLFLVEFLLFFAFAILTTLGAEQGRTPWHHVLVAVLILLPIAFIVLALSWGEAGFWPLIALILLLSDKIPYLFQPAEQRKAEAFQRMLGVMGRGVLIMVAMMLPAMISLPTLGLTAEVYALLEQDPAKAFTTPHFVQSCVIYFGVLGALRALDYTKLAGIQNTQVISTQRVDATK